MLQQNPWLRSFSLLLPVVMSAAGMIGHFICMHGIWQPLNRWKVQPDLFSNLKCKSKWISDEFYFKSFSTINILGQRQIKISNGNLYPMYLGPSSFLLPSSSKWVKRSTGDRQRCKVFRFLSVISLFLPCCINKATLPRLLQYSECGSVTQYSNLMCK